MRVGDPTRNTARKAKNARNFLRRDYRSPANSRKYRRFGRASESDHGVGTPWLGREDSNLRMAESKSDNFSFSVSQHSENVAEIASREINRLSPFSEIMRLIVVDHPMSGRSALTGCGSLAGMETAEKYGRVRP
jgi:hypothetical protein